MEELQGPQTSGPQYSDRLQELGELLKRRKDVRLGLLAALLLGFVMVALCIKAMRGSRRSQALDLAQAQRIPSDSASFDILLAPGWENLSAETNLGVASENRKEVMLRQKGQSGSRLLMIQKFSPRGAEGKKVAGLLGPWIMGQKQEIRKLQQETASSSRAGAEAGGMPVELVQMVSPSAGSSVFVGVFPFKGSFYEFSFVSSYPRDSELLLELLGSIRDMKKAAPAPKKPAVAATKAATKKVAARPKDQPKDKKSKDTKR